MSNIYKEVLSGCERKKIVVEYDELADSICFDDYDNYVKIVGFHSRYKIGEHNYSSPQEYIRSLLSMQDVKDLADTIYEEAILLDDKGNFTEIFSEYLEEEYGHKDSHADFDETLNYARINLQHPASNARELLSVGFGEEEVKEIFGKLYDVIFNSIDCPEESIFGIHKKYSKKYMDIVEKNHVILPLYMYDHSGLSFSTTPFACQWDSGQCGYVSIDMECVKKNFEWNIEESKKHIEFVVDWYSDYMNGRVFETHAQELQCFKTENLTTGEITYSEEWVFVEDSCIGGWIGDYQAKNSVLAVIRETWGTDEVENFNLLDE